MKNVIISLGESILFISGVTIVVKATSKLYDKAVAKIESKKSKKIRSN